MKTQEITIAEHLLEASKIGEEISITGKWVPKHKGGLFRKSPDSKEMLKEWEDIHLSAKNDPGILSTEINHAVGQDAILVHHVFKNAEAVLNYFNTTAAQHVKALMEVALPEEHFVRGLNISHEVKTTIQAKVNEVTFGEYAYGYVKEDYSKPDVSKAIQVTAKWACKPGQEAKLDELNHWWQQVGKEAYTLEEGLLRFEVFKVEGESALIIHETFDTNEQLQYHLSKGTANMFKKNLDEIAAPTSYFFRGPVSWTIRTYSKFMGLPATYSSLGSNHTTEGGSYSDGITKSLNNNQTNINMENQEVMVVYKWTAKEGNADKLKAIYNEVTNQMNANEPGALNVECYFDEVTSTLVVMDLFQDAGAVGFHLGTTAAGHFENLLQIANPGEFLFCGNVPEEMKQAATGMGLQATFAPKVFGFKR